METVARLPVGGRWRYFIVYEDALGNDDEMVYMRPLETADPCDDHDLWGGYQYRSEIEIIDPEIAHRYIVFAAERAQRVKTAKEMLKEYWGSDAGSLFRACVSELEGIGLVPIGTLESVKKA